MAPIAAQKETTFIGWIEDLIKLPFTVPLRTLAVVKDKYNNYLVLNTRVFPATGVTEAEVITAFTEGPESVADIKGVQTTINLTDLFKNGPVATVRTLGVKTLQQIADLDEISQDRRGYFTDLLTKGKAEDPKNGNAPLEEPRNWTLKYLAPKRFFPFQDGFPITRPAGPGTPGQSQIQLLKNLSRDPAREDYEDRMTVEENTDRKHQHKTYMALAAALTKLSGHMESPLERNVNHTESIVEFNRSIARELGINLDEVLPTKKPDGTINYGQLHQTMIAGWTPGNVANLRDINYVLSDPQRIANAVFNGDLTRYNRLDPRTQAWLKSWLRQEELQLRMQVGKLGWRQLPEDVIQRWQQIGLNATITGTDYASLGHFKKSLLINDITHEAKRTGLEAWLEFDAFAPEIRRDARESAITRARLDPQWQQAYVARNHALMASVENEYANRMLRRIEAAKRSLDIANGLFFASTTKEMLEAIQQGSFIKQLFVSTRFLGMLPLAGKGLRSPGDLATGFGPENLPIVRDITKFIEQKLIPATGLNFEAEAGKLPSGLAKIPGTWKDSYVSVEWKEKHPTGHPRAGQPTGNWNMHLVKAKDAQGIFGDYGAFDIIHRIDKYGLADIYPTPLWANPQAMFTNLNNLENFLVQLETAGQQLAAGTPATTAIHNIARELGLTDPQNLQKLRDQIQLFRTHGRGFLENIMARKGLTPDERWELLMNVFRQKKTGQFIKIFAGPLNNWNRLANHWRNYLYKNIIFGNKFYDIPIIGKLLGRPFRLIQGFLKNLGMSDEIGLMGAVKRWRWVSKIQAFGKALKNLVGPSQFKAAAAHRYLSKILGQKLANKLLMKVATKAIGQAILRWAGIILANVAGIVTGGLAWVLTALGTIAFKFVKNMVTLHPGKAWKESKEEAKKLFNTIKKIIMAALTCVLGCLLVVVVTVVLIVGSAIAWLNPFGGGAYSQTALSKKISVMKTAQMSGRDILYKIIITNKTSEEIELKSFEDNLTFTYPCTVNDGKTVNVSSNPSLGTATVPTLDTLGDPKIPGGQSKVITFRLFSTTPTSGTYVNTVNATVVGEQGRRATYTVSTDIGDGGCKLCPSGWPTKPFKVTQGPMTVSTHKNAEAVDMASYTNQNIMGQDALATHNGVVRAVPSPCAPDDHSTNCGYGNYIELISPKGFKTIYAHLSSYSVSTGDSVNAGDKIGSVGTTGNSTGPHLHYEFVNTSIQCIPGYNLELRSVQGNSYVPEDIPRGCIGADECNMNVQ